MSRTHSNQTTDRQRGEGAFVKVADLKKERYMSLNRNISGQKKFSFSDILPNK